MHILCRVANRLHSFGRRRRRHSNRGPNLSFTIASVLMMLYADGAVVRRVGLRQVVSHIAIGKLFY